MTAVESLCKALAAHLSGQRPNVPEAGRLAWAWFADLSAARTYHAAGPNPLQFCEIAAYAALHRWPMRSQHIDLLTAMDRVWLDHANSAQRGTATGTDDQTGAKVLPRSSGQPLTADVFDAVFS